MAIWQGISRRRVSNERKRHNKRTHKILRQAANRSLRIEPFEERLLLAIDGPQLLAAIPATGVVINEASVLTLAPREILLRFNRPIDTATIGSSIQFIRSGDDVWNNGNDVTITPGFIGVEEAPNEVIVRFAENLPDDNYRMIIVGAGQNPLRDTSGQPFNGGANLVRNFSLDLPPQVVAIVPQPITRNANGTLSQSVNTIEVYFNANDPLNPQTAQDRFNYQLIRTGGTATPNDDVRINPTSVTYSAATGKAVLTFDTAQLMVQGTYRLRIGNSEPLATTFTTLTPGAAGTSLDTAANLGTGGNAFTATSGAQTIVVNDTLTSVPTNGIIWPGSPLEPGERPTTSQTHVNGSSNNGPIPVISYNFQSVYGSLFGQQQFNLITEVQKQRVREVFEYYAYYLGVQFQETASSGWTIAVGDPRVLGATINVGGVAGGGLAIMNSFQNWGASETRGSFFNTTMHEIGHLLGLGHNYETPAVQGSGVQDGVFPGDHDLVAGRYLWPHLGNDINVYRFNLQSAGTLNIETIAERLKSLGVAANPSQLDSVLTLFDAAGNIIARNDDYYGRDSFLQLSLDVGTYYVAVTSTGNTNFDPRVANSGGGGTTTGNFQLRMTFTPAIAQGSGIRDTSGNLLDGDNDGLPGGVNNFWFKVANTIYVDKAATSTTGAPGSLANPYRRIDEALAAAPQGSIVRIVGNGGADGNLNTLEDNLSYNIGFDNQNLPLSDGTRFDIPRGVTVMIDAGAILKFRAANLHVGTTDVNINRSEGALQVLGTPTSSVHFTSYFDRSIGTDPGVNTSGLMKGNWGGIVFRNDSDLEQHGIFLNYVNHASISWGGGNVSVSGTSNVYRPIHMETARPTITFNTITNSADAAMLATPNSFEENSFIGANYHADYSRVGPRIYGNTLSQNSLNGLFILVRTNPNSPLDKLTVNGRIANTDIVHILTETLLINGNPGGNSSAGGSLEARPSGRLAIDPGAIIKLGGGRFETEIGGTFIAEGTIDRPIYFTSLYDDRYGASGTSDTTNNQDAQLPAPGDWGGFIFGPTSTASIDYALIAFAGGETRFEGLLDNMQPIEIHQAKVRVANSTLDSNRLVAAGSRSGRGGADAAAIYIRGAQPVILNNVIKNNEGGAAISINLNALNSQMIDDWGRSRGRIGLAGSFPKNSGPLIRNNLIGDNSLNGMRVRGGLLTTNGVWDDTDIVHFFTETITLTNQQSLSGTLRLQSSPNESLVVKALGTNVDIVAGGQMLDIDDRTGGSLQIVGAPGHPVVITSLKDDSVGAGLTPAGLPQTDTLNRKGVVAPELPDLPNSGPVILDTTPRDVHGRSSAGLDGWDTLARLVAYVHENSQVEDKPNQILVIGFEDDDDLGRAYSAEAITWAAQQSNLQVVFAVSQPGGIPAQMGQLDNYSMVFVSSHSSYPLPVGRDLQHAEIQWWGGTADFMLDDLNATKGQLWDYIHNRGGGLLVMALDPAENPYEFAVPDGADPLILRKGGGNTATATELAPAGFASVGLTDTLLNHGAPYRSVFEGSTGFNRLEPWVVDPVTGEVIMLGTVAGGKGVGAPRDILMPGDWGSIRLDVLSNDRNVEIVLETEQGFAASGDTNNTPSKAQYLGILSKDQFSGDDNVRLGFEIHGGLSQTVASPGGADVDVYSFHGTAGTTVWLDIDRTSLSLDSVVELIDANGAVIARSVNSILESAGTLPLVGSAKPMQIGTNSASTFSQPDFYTTNQKDAGMRVTLPGVVGSVGTYFVRVRSNSPNLNNVTGGITKGNYVLQVRLQEKDEFPGSTVRYADVRYANNGIEVVGKPESSILVSNTVRTGLGNSTFQSAQDLGNLLESSNVTIDVAANLASAGDVHWYKFSLNYEQIQSITGLNDGLRTFAAMLQVNYADGLGGPDTTLSLYDSSGRLLYVARDGQIADSLPRPNVGGIGADLANLKHGSFGPLDPSLGPVHLQAGAPKLYDGDGNLIESSVVTYYVAISSNARLPEALTATFAANSSNPLIRLEPVDSVARIIDDRVGFTGSGITTAGSSGALFPVSPAGNVVAQLNSYADEYHLGDVVLFMNTGSGLRTVNPFTGAAMTNPGGASNFNNIAMRNDGKLYSLTTGDTNLAAGNYVQLNTANGSVISSSDDGLQAFVVTEDPPGFGQPGTFAQTPTPVQYDALAFLQSDNNTSRRLFAIAHRTDNPNQQTPPSNYFRTTNLLFELDPETGQVLNPVPGGAQVWNPLVPGSSGTDHIPVGVLNTPGNEQIIGLTIVDNRMFGITGSGLLVEVEDFLPPPSTNPLISSSAFVSAQFQVPLPAGVTLTGLTSGPRFVEGGQYRNTLFAVDSQGRMYAFDTSGVPRGVFLDGAWTMNTGVAGAQGLAFSSFDFNLWHATTNRGTDVGHGINPAPNNALRTTAYTNPQQLAGFGSYYFGVSPNPGAGVPDLPQPGAGAYGSNQELLNTYAVPGGTYGTLTTSTFDLAGYSAMDKPTFYFNYLLNTPDSNSNISATDIFRVFASVDGVNWDLLATNNVTPGFETPFTVTPSGGNYLGQNASQKRQALWDNTTIDGIDDVIWRQARVDLGDFAGQSGIRLRFQFTTAGTMGSGLSNMGTGAVLKALAGSQLNDGDQFIISGQAFVFRKGVPATLDNEIAITNAMTSVEVAHAMATALDRVFIAAAGNFDDPDIFSVAKVVKDELRLFQRTVNSAGPLPFNAGQTTGDSFGQFTNASRDRYLGTFEGVYIDDFIVGFASRGEMVTGAASIAESEGTSTLFGVVPNAVGSPPQALTGNYQLQIRPAQQFAAVDNQGRTVVTSTFDVNDRFAQAITLVARAAAQITDGQTFVIDDGTQVMRFEFNLTGGQTVPGSILIELNAADSAATVAIKIRDAINNAVLSQGFKVRAATHPGGARVDLFDALSVVPHSGLGSGLQNVLVFNTVGDTRPQQGIVYPGQTIIQASTITHSRQVGVLVTPLVGQVNETGFAFTFPGQFPVGMPGRTGSIANLPIANTRGWVSGVTIKNNLITHSGRTGIAVLGDPNASYAYAQGLTSLGWNASNVQSASGRRDTELFVPFVRVLNNTVYDAKVGIASANVASATIMNNILANIRINTAVNGNIIQFPGVGIYVDPGSSINRSLPGGITSKFGGSVVTANLYQNNSNNLIGSTETLAINLAAGAPLFVDPQNGNFYLQAGALAIDSSVDSLLDRPELVSVLQPLGFAQSPILAPELDMLGQQRVDDPTVDPPAGVGGNVFKDRGALERADSLGPTAVLLNPIDNDPAGADRNALPHQVQLVNAILTNFTIQLLDDASGIDDATVDISKFTITRTIGGQTVTLEPNFDYALSYDTNSKIVRLIPAQGIWVNGTYTITLDRSSGGIRDMAGNVLQENAPPLTRFVIDLTDTIVSGWQNPNNRFDVNNDGIVSGQDLIILINRILAGQTGPLPLVANAPPYLDVNGDGALRVSDVLGVVNEILRLREADPLTAEPQTAEPPVAEPLVQPLVAESAVEAEPLVDTNVIVAGLSLDNSAEPQVVSGGPDGNYDLGEELLPEAYEAAVLADRPLDESEELDLWEDGELDGVLTDLAGDLRKRVYV